MNKSESKYFNTAVRMDEALLSLLEEKDFQYLTVKEICSRAQVNRSTFYLHYDTIGDLLSETIDYTMDKFHQKFNAMDVVSREQIDSLPLGKLILITPEYLIPYLEFTRENRRVFSVAVSQPNALQTDRIFHKFYFYYIHPIMKRFGLQEFEIDYILTFYLRGMFAVICKWIQRGCVEDVQTMAQLLKHCVLPEKIANLGLSTDSRKTTDNK